MKIKSFILILISLVIVANGFSQAQEYKELKPKGKYKNYILATKYINKGNKHLKKRKFLWALQAYRKSVDYYPLAAAYTNMAIVYRIKGDYRKMMLCLKKAGHLGDRRAQRIWELNKKGL